MELTGWGKSMYGGWYLNYLKDGIHSGKHFNTRTELYRFVQNNNLSLTKAWRLDN